MFLSYYADERGLIYFLTGNIKYQGAVGYISYGVVYFYFYNIFSDKRAIQTYHNIKQFLFKRNSEFVVEIIINFS